MMFARTDRLLLRPGWTEDTPALARALRGDGRSANAAADALADAEAYLAEPRDATLPQFLVTLRTHSAPLVIGTARLTRLPSERIDVSCWIAEAHRGYGFASEAGRALRDIAASLGGHPVDVPLAA